MAHDFQRPGPGRIQQHQIEAFPRPGHADYVAAQIRLVETGVVDAVAPGILLGTGHHGELPLDPHHFTGLTGQRQGEVADAAEQIQHLVILGRPQPRQRLGHHALVDGAVDLNEVARGECKRQAIEGVARLKLLAQGFDALIRRLKVEVYPLGLGKRHQQGAIRLVGATSVAQQHHDALFGLDELRMPQLALALQAIEALAQGGDEGREGIGQHGAARHLHQVIGLTATEAHPGAATVLVKLDGETADPAIAAGLPLEHGLERRRLDVAKALEQADQPGLLDRLLIRFAEVLGTATAALAIMGAEGIDAIGRRGHYLLQGGVGIVLLVIDDASLDQLTGECPFDEDGLALMTADTDTVVVQTVYRKFNTLGLGGFLLGLEKLGHKTWCL